MTNKNLFLFTENYPYGKGESFIENEIPFLANNFKHIFIFPQYKDNNAIRSIPQNAKIIDFKPFQPYNRIFLFVKNIKLIYCVWFNQLCYKSDRWLHIRYFVKNINFLMHSINDAKFLNYTLQLYTENNYDVFYTYWFDRWTFLLSILKFQKKIPNLITRAHGYDLFIERTKLGFFQFRIFQIMQLNKIITVSNAGYKYLQDKYPKHYRKFATYYLGVNDNGLNKFKIKDHLTIYSCSNVIPLKRIHLIISLLKKINRKIHWVHIGDGPLLSKFKEEVKKLPQNITYKFYGALSNLEVINLYKNESIDLFIHMSETEGGVPVAIQEAASFGVPTIAYDVGGVAEIVNNNTGYLIDFCDKTSKIIEIIENFHRSPFYSPEARIRIKEFWRSNFYSTINYQNFINFILLKESC